MNLTSSLLIALAVLTGTVYSGPQRGPDAHANLPDRPERAVDRMTNGGALDLPSVIDRTQLYWDSRADGTLLVRGADYKASFDAQGFAFTPFLGSEAPRNFPLRLRLAEVLVGGKSLALSPATQVSRNDDQIVWQRGLLEERVAVDVQRMEQSFWFPELPREGALTLRLQGTTDLVCTADGAGLLFSNEHGGVRYSGAVAIDEAGRRVEIPSRWVQGHIEIHVPASFLESAQGAILVDPFLSTFPIDSVPGAILDHPDLAYDYEADQYMVVMREQFSGADHDIYSWFIDGFTGATSNGTYVFAGPEVSGIPSVAYHQQTRSFMTVLSQRDLALSNTSIQGRNRNSVTGALSALFAFDGGTPGIEVFDPVVGGDHWTSGASYMLVAWVRFGAGGGGTTVVCQLVNGDGTTAGPVQDLEVFSNLPDAKLRISKSTGNTGFTSYWQVVWQSVVSGSGDVLLQSQRVAYNGLFEGTRKTLRTNPGGPAFSHVSVSDLLTYGANSTRADALVSFGYGTDRTTSLWTVIVNQSGALGLQQMYLMLNQSSSQYKDAVIATTNDHWILTWTQDTGVIYSVAGQPVGSRFGMSEGRFQVVDTGDTVTHLTACATASGGGPDVWTDAMLAWSQGVGDKSIEGARVFASPEQTAGIQYCTGLQNSTGQGAFLVALGNRVPTSLLTLRTANLPPNVFGYYLVGTDFDSVPFPGGSLGYLCVGGALGRYNDAAEIQFSGGAGEISLTIDPQAIPLATGNVAALSGQSYYFQGWYRDTVGGNPVSNFSNAVRVPFL